MARRASMRPRCPYHGTPPRGQRASPTNGTHPLSRCPGVNRPPWGAQAPRRLSKTARGCISRGRVRPPNNESLSWVQGLGEASPMPRHPSAFDLSLSHPLAPKQRRRTREWRCRAGGPSTRRTPPWARGLSAPTKGLARVGPEPSAPGAPRRPRPRRSRGGCLRRKQRKSGRTMRYHRSLRISCTQQLHHLRSLSPPAASQGKHNVGHLVIRLTHTHTHTLS